MDGLSSDENGIMLMEEGLLFDDEMGCARQKQ
jgi:hypothetical protein